MALSDARMMVILGIAVILLTIALAGCTATDRIEVDPEVVAAHELTDIPWQWCSKDKLYLCPKIRQGGELFMLPLGGRIGDGTSLGGDTWDARGATVQAVGGE